MGEPAAGSAGHGASARGGAARGGDERLIGEYYDTYARTRLMLVREFESCGASRGRAVSAAQSFLDRLVFVLYVEDAGMVGEKDLLRSGVVDVMNTRFSGCGARVWGCIVDELFDWFGRGSSDPRMAGFGGSLFGAELGPDLSFLDRRPADFFAGLLPPRGRRPRRLWEGAEGAAGRNRDTSPAVRCLLDLASYDYAGQMRVAVLARVFERSVADLEALAGRGGHAGARRDALRIPEYAARYACRRAIMAHLSRSGAAEDPASLVAEYAGDLGALGDRLARIRVLDPACGAGAFLAEAASALLDVHREIRQSREAGGDAGRGTLDGAIDEGRAGAIVRDNVWGMGASEQSVEATRLTLFLLAASPNEGLPDLSRNIVVGNAASGGCPDWGDAFPGAPGEGFSVVVGRMPRAECGTAPPAAGHGAPADGGGPECAYYRRSLAALAEGGRMGLVSGGEWLRPECGRPLQRAILDSAEIARIVVPAFGAAGGAGMAVSLLRRGRPRGGSVAELARARSAGDFERARHRLVAQIAQDGMEPGDWRALFP